MVRRLLPALAATTLFACSRGEKEPGESAMPAAGAPVELTITARDFTFEMPDTVPAGLTRIRLVNQGPQWHHAQLVRFNDGKTLADLEAALKGGATAPPAWVEEAGGPNPPQPGAEAVTIQTLEPGNYAVVCFVDLPDHVPHIMKGMSRSFVVAPSASAAAADPVADVNIALADYSFTLSAPLTAGRHTVRVENGAAQAHEVAIFRLKDGKTMDDFMAFAQTYAGEAPATALGGIAGIKPGSHDWFDVTLDPGTYVLICFLPDKTDGKPHVMHGMMHPFTIS